MFKLIFMDTLFEMLSVWGIRCLACDESAKGLRVESGQLKLGRRFGLKHKTRKEEEPKQGHCHIVVRQGYSV